MVKKKGCETLAYYRLYLILLVEHGRYIKDRHTQWDVTLRDIVFEHLAMQSAFMNIFERLGCFKELTELEWGTVI